MKFVALVSGGKDSLYSIMECCRLGHELLGCVHLGAVPNADEESYMYQSAASEALVTLVEECLGVPLIHYQRVGTSINTTLVYQQALEGDEVEDLYQALQMAKVKFPLVEAVSSGAILSTYQRIRIENVCSRLGLTSLSYLWRAAPQHDLLDRMIRHGITAVLVRAACPPGLNPHKHLNKTLQELQPLFLRLNKLYQFHVCGEGGEYESLVLDCPLYKKKLVLDQVEVVELEGDEGVGVLKIIKCHAAEKSDGEGNSNMNGDSSGSNQPKDTTGALSASQSTPLVVPRAPRIRYLPRVKFVGGGLWHVSEIMAASIPPITKIKDGTSCTEVELAVVEARAALDLLGALLQKHGCTAQDVLFVHLYLSEISHFASINAYYREFFGTLLPPSRSCVAVGRHVLPGGRRVSLDCMIQCGSGAYLRCQRNQSAYADAALANTSFQLRQVLHVQSISHWAPVCVGPYSQVNTLRSTLHFMAGQIGLKPETMVLHDDWEDQLRQCWTNVANILDALDGGSLEHLLSGVVYVADHIYFRNSSTILQNLENICWRQMRRNGGVVAGRVDSPNATEINANYDSESGNDDEGEIPCPLLVVSIPEMPVGAVVEVEVIAATKQAASCLPKTGFASPSDSIHVEKSADTTLTNNVSWDTGHDFSLPGRSQLVDASAWQIQNHTQELGVDCASFVTITAHFTNTETTGDHLDMDPFEVIKVMARPASSRGNSRNVLHVRLFYVASTILEATGEKVLQDDGSILRSALQAALSTCFQSASPPSSSVVPVQKIDQLLPHDSAIQSTCATISKSSTIFMALQVLVIDPIQIETDLWIHHGR